MQKYRTSIIFITSIFLLSSLVYFFSSYNSDVSESKVSNNASDNFYACMSAIGYVENLDSLARKYATGDITHEIFIEELQKTINYLTYARDMANGDTSLAIDGFASELYKIKQEIQYDPLKGSSISFSEIISSGENLGKKCK